jgi:hypothetical protein
MAQATQMKQGGNFIVPHQANAWYQASRDRSSVKDVEREILRSAIFNLNLAALERR